MDEKAELFGALAVDNLLVCRFDGAMQQTGAREFLQQLGRWVRLRRLIFGPGFALGKGREGTTEVLRQLGQELGFDLEEVTPFVSEPATGHVSGTAIGTSSPPARCSGRRKAWGATLPLPGR